MWKGGTPAPRGVHNGMVLRKIFHECTGFEQSVERKLREKLANPGSSVKWLLH